MILQNNSLCEDCAEHVKDESFWHASSNSKYPSPQQRWGVLHYRDYQDIEKTKHCPLCRLVCEALKQSEYINGPETSTIYYSSKLFGEYKVRDSTVSPVNRDSATRDDIPNWQLHRINHLHVSTFQHDADLPREFARIEQSPDIVYCCEVYQGSIMLLRESEEDNYFLHGRRIDTLFNTILASNWIKKCIDSHGDICLASNEAQRPSRLINIRDRRVQLAPLRCTYAILSYRWKKKGSQMKLNSSTESRLSTAGGLADHVGGIHITIKDAIILCERLGIEYLWVDALCIPQEHAAEDIQCPYRKEREAQLNAMASIYAGAYVTIVGNNSLSGLPGVRPRLRLPQEREHVGNFSLAVVQRDFNSAMKHYNWKSRAWTFQEAVQSRRLLIFTKHQVFFRCKTALWCEDTHREAALHDSKDYCDVDLPPMDTSFWHNMLPDLPFTFSNYTDAVKDYTSREMTVEERFPDGFNFLKDLWNEPFVHCLPERCFGQALTFETWGGTIRSPDKELPSWCWCGWKVAPRGVFYDGCGNFEYWTSFLYPKNWHAADEPQCFPAEADKVRYFDIVGTLSRLDEVKLSHVIVFCAWAATFYVDPGPEGFDEDCPLTILPASSGNSSNKTVTTAILSLDCAKNRGDSVECVAIGQWKDEDRRAMVRLLIIETDNEGISRRIGSCFVGLSLWVEVADPLTLRTIYLV
jgi:hypothetical protein